MMLCHEMEEKLDLIIKKIELEVNKPPGIAWRQSTSIGGCLLCVLLLAFRPFVLDVLHCTLFYTLRYIKLGKSISFLKEIHSEGA